MTDSTLNRFLASGTNAERLAFTPDPPTPGSGPGPTYIWVETDTGDTFAWDYGGAAWQAVGGGNTTALSTSLSQVSSSLSSEISSRISGDSSLSTVISSEVSSRISGDTSLSTVISGSTSTVNSRIDSLSTAVGSGGWTVLYSNAALTNPTTSVDVDVTGYNDVMVIGRNITLASSGFRGVFCSIDGGSTYKNTNGDYVTISSLGVEANQFLSLYHGTASASARSFGGIIRDVKSTSSPKWCEPICDAQSQQLFVADNSQDVDHIRVTGQNASGGATINMTGGELYIFAR